MTVIALESVAKLRRMSEAVCEEIFQPPPALTVSECADQHRVLPKTSAEPGQWRTARVPYLREIMDVLGDETVREVVFPKSAQVGGTSVGENWILYVVKYDPCGVLMLWPTEKKLRSWSTKRLNPLIDDSLPDKFPRSKRREAGQTIASKEFPGGFLQMLTAKSSSDLRSTSARYGYIEEEDEIDQEIKGQGDPIGQFDARFRTFWNAKQYKTSTPTLEGASRIWSDWERSDQRRFYVPCPHCGHRQVLRWRDGKDDQDESGAYRLLWETDANGEVIPGSSHYLCEACGVLIEEHHKMAMLLSGEWVPTNPGRRTVGFHINTLYSPLCSWDDIASAFEKAKRDRTQMQTFVNLWLGLPYRPPGSALDQHFLAARAEDYGEGVDVPHGVGVVVGYVDVQGDRLELFLWGYGAQEESWFLSWEVFEGDPGQDDVWKEMDARLKQPLRHASGAPVAIAALCVDANYQTEAVHRFCDPRRARNIVATIGKGGRPRKLLEEPTAEKYKRGAKKRQRPTHLIGVDGGKDLLASRLRLTLREDQTAPPGYVHFPTGLDPVFYDQLTAERLVTEYVQTRPVRVWKLISGRRNEALDGAVGAMAALQYLVLRKALTREELGARAAKYSAYTGDGSAPKSLPAASRRRVRSRGIG